MPDKAVARLTNVTPAEFACPPFGTCPSIHLAETDTYVVVGRLVQPDEFPELEGRVGPDEVAIEIPRDLLDKLIN